MARFRLVEQVSGRPNDHRNSQQLATIHDTDKPSPSPSGKKFRIKIRGPAKRIERVYRSAKLRYRDVKKILVLYSEEEQVAILKHFRHYAVRSAQLKLLQTRSSRFWSLPTCIILAVLCSSPFLVRGMSSSPSAYAAAGEAEMIVIVVVLAVCIPFLIAMRSRKTSAYIPNIAYVAGAIAVAAIFLPNQYRHFSNEVFNGTGPKYFLFVLTLEIFIASISFVLVALIIILAIPFAFRQHQDVLIANHLIDCELQLARGSIKFSDPDNKRRICHQLEQAASYLENGIPRAIALPDPRAKLAIQQRCQASAAQLRNIQTSVIIANDDTIDNVKRQISLFIAAIVQGKYDLLPAANSLEAQTRDRKTAYLQILKTTIVAIIPFACLLGVKYAGIKISAGFSDWATVIAIIWASITFISLLDPLYKARLTTIQDFISAIRGKDS